MSKNLTPDQIDEQADSMAVLLKRVDDAWEKLDHAGAITKEDVQGLRSALQAMIRPVLTPEQIDAAQPFGAQHTDDGRYVVTDEWLADFAHNVLAVSRGAHTAPATRGNAG